MHPERLTAGRCGVTCDPNRTFGPRPIECDFITPEPTGDATLDGVRNMAALANHFGELCIGAKWHDLAGRIAAGHAGAREEAEAKLAVLRGLSDEPSDDLKERMRMEHGPARSRGAA